MDGLPVAADKMVPCGQRFAQIEQFVSAAIWHPPDLRNCLGREDNAVGHILLAVVIVRAAAGFAIEQFAMKARIGDVAALFIFQLEQATFGAAIAHRFPFVRCHLFE